MPFLGIHRIFSDAFGMAVFIYIIEAFITLLQAYIFTFLSINFVYQSIHQDH